MGTYLLKLPAKSSNPQIDLPDPYRHFDRPLKPFPHQQQLKANSFKIDDILSTKAYTNSPPPSSASSHCSSSLSSLPSPYQSHKPATESSNQTEFLLSHASSFLNSNPFMTGGASCFGNYPTMDSNKEIFLNFKNYTAFMDQLNLQKQQQQSSFALDYLKHHQSSIQNQPGYFLSNQLVKNDESTREKLSIIDKIAKKIDSNSNMANDNADQKPHVYIKSKNSRLDKKDTEQSKNRSLKLKKRPVGSGGCCGDLNCSSGLDQHQLPMCLRGTSEEQVHLASLFNTLIHHKKCRRTRTVFTDMQLIGLEKRFENQKYLSTPDRIQLADYLGLSQLQVKTWYQNRRMKWKKKVLKDGSKKAPTKPKGRPKKDSIPSFSDILKAAAAEKMNSTGSTTEGKDSSIDESRSVFSGHDGEEDEIELSDDDEDEEVYDVEDSDCDHDGGEQDGEDLILT